MSVSSKFLSRSKVIGNVEYLLYTEKYRHEAFNVLKNFIRDGPLHIGAAVPENPESVKEMEKVFSEMLDDSHLSAIAKEVTTNRVIGVITNSISNKPSSREETNYKMYEKYMKSENTTKLLNVWKYIDSKIDYFHEYNVNCILNLGFMTVLPEYREKKIGSILLNFILEIFNDWYHNPEQACFIPENLRQYLPELATYHATSRYSQKMDEKNTSAERILIFPHKDFVFKGKTFADRIGDQNSISVLGAIRPKIIGSKN